jgi:hypothetical protein
MATERQKEVARAQAKGRLQIRVVNELLAGPVKMNYSHWGVSYGRAELAGQSWRHLRTRLRGQGFTFVTDYRHGTVTMRVPEPTK